MITDTLKTSQEFYDWADLVLEEFEAAAAPDGKLYFAKQIFFEGKKILSRTDLDTYRLFYIDQLLAYGLFSKMAQMDAKYAAAPFREALRLEQDLPIAHYRLGHLAYTEGNYADSIFHFQKSLEPSRTDKYGIIQYQVDIARKVLSFCCLKLFESYKNEAVLSREYTELDSLINTYMGTEMNHAKPIVFSPFQPGTGLDFNPITYDEYISTKSKADESRDIAYIDNYISYPVIGFQGREAELSMTMLNTLMNIIKGNYTEFQVMRQNTINQQIRRVRSHLARIGLEEPVFRIDNSNQRPVITDCPDLYIFKRIED